MFAAVEAGLPQDMIGKSAMVFQEKIDSGQETIVGVNKYREDEEPTIAPRPLERPDRAAMETHIARFKAFKAERSQAAVTAALDTLARAANAAPGTPGQNVYEKLVEAAMAGATHGELCACLRRELGFGHPLVMP
jgi:methylmalonyl-CoA mutase N-terminal domain/subunit